MRRLAAVLLVAVLASPARGEGLRGYLAIQGDRVLASEHAEQLFTPASVQKIVVAAAALHYLGYGHQIETVVRAHGPIAGGVLRGDLVLEAAGDPTWSSAFFPGEPEAPFRALADQVHRAGIGWVEGDLVLDLSRFPGRRAPTSRSQTEMGLALGAPVSGLAIDENTAEIRIAAGRRIGERASVTTDAGIELHNDTVTVAATRHGKGSVEFLPQWGDGTIRVRGEYPVSEAPYVVRVSLPAPDRAAGERLRDHLRRAGVELTGIVRVTEGVSAKPRLAANAGGDAGADLDPDPVVARIFSPPLSDIVVPILRDSSNWTAEMLVLQVALARTGAGRYDDGVEALGAFMTEEVGVAKDQFALDDVCGLSPEDLLSPQAVVSLLRFAWSAPWRDVFLAALARPGAGTLAAWPPLPPLAAKTGTLKHTLALAGMLAGDDSATRWIASVATPEGPAPGTAAARAVAPRAQGEVDAAAPGVVPPAVAPEPILFAIFFNHDLRDRGAQRREIGELLRAWRQLGADGS